MITSLIRQHPRLSLAIALMLLLLVVVVAAGIFALSRVYAMPAQPIPFQHSTHIQAGVECLFCHPGASSGPVAVCLFNLNGAVLAEYQLSGKSPQNRFPLDDITASACIVRITAGGISYSQRIVTGSSD